MAREAADSAAETMSWEDREKTELRETNMQLDTKRCSRPKCRVNTVKLPRQWFPLTPAAHTEQQQSKSTICRLSFRIMQRKFQKQQIRTLFCLTGRWLGNPSYQAAVYPRGLQSIKTCLSCTKEHHLKLQKTQRDQGYLPKWPQEWEGGKKTAAGWRNTSVSMVLLLHRCCVHNLEKCQASMTFPLTPKGNRLSTGDNIAPSSSSSSSSCFVFNSSSQSSHTVIAQRFLFSFSFPYLLCGATTQFQFGVNQSKVWSRH